MRHYKKIWVVVAVTVLLAASMGMAVAQTRGGVADGLELASPEELNLTPQQQVGRANEYLSQMEQGAQTVRRQLDQARAARDVVKVLCINDKLLQMDFSVRSARDRVAALGAAASQNDVDRAKHDFTVVLALRDRMQSLLAEANQCIGEETGFIDEDTEVTVEIDPGIPDDPADYPSDALIITPPTLSSPIQ